MEQKTEIEIGSVWVKNGRAYMVASDCKDNYHEDGYYNLVPYYGFATEDWFSDARCIFRPSDNNKPQNTIKLRAAVGQYDEDHGRYYIYGCSTESDDELIANIYGWGCNPVGWIEADFPVPELPTVEGVVR